jgi:hypothetical protein
MTTKSTNSQPDASQAADLMRRATTLANRIEGEPDRLGRLILSGKLARGHLFLQLDASALAKSLNVPVSALSPELTNFAQPSTLHRRGIEAKIIAGETLAAPDPMLQRTLAETHLWARALRAGKSLTAIAQDSGRSKPYIRIRIPWPFSARSCKPRSSTAGNPQTSPSQSSSATAFQWVGKTRPGCSGSGDRSRAACPASGPQTRMVLGRCVPFTMQTERALHRAETRRGNNGQVRRPSRLGAVKTDPTPGSLG